MNPSSAWRPLQRSLVSNLTGAQTLSHNAAKEKVKLNDATEIWVRTLFLHACEYLDVGDIVEFVGCRGADGVFVHLRGAQLAVHR